MMGLGVGLIAGAMFSFGYFLGHYEGLRCSCPKKGNR